MTELDGPKLTLHSSDQRALDAFAHSSELVELEKQLVRFNIFEAMGAVRAELRHSDFLAFLLTPQQTHRLGSAFLRGFLDAVFVAHGAQLDVTVDNLAQWNVTRTTVRREWQHIDVLILDDDGKWVIIIENKINADEGLTQLEEYYKIVKQYYPNRTIIAIYLTPDGRLPKELDSPFLPLDYGVVADTLERVRMTNEHAQDVDPDVRVAVAHYISMLRRYVVSDSDIAQLCRKIYEEHRQAIDLIYQHRPMPHLSIRDALKAMVQEDPRFQLEVDKSPRHLMIAVTEWWHKFPVLQMSGHCALTLGFSFSDSHVQLLLQMGPFDSKATSTVRQQLLDMAAAHRPPFQPRQATVIPRFTAIYTATLLERSPVPLTVEEIDEVRRKWSDFLDGDFQAISAVLEGQGWLRQGVGDGSYSKE